MVNLEMPVLKSTAMLGIYPGQKTLSMDIKKQTAQMTSHSMRQNTTK
jgi:hypothetical protein